MMPLMVGGYACLCVWLLAWRFRRCRGRNRARESRAIGITVALFATISFTLLNYLIRRGSEPEHFAGPEVPSAADWSVFTVNHLLRAGDLLDFLEAYGVHLTDVRPASDLTRAVVAVYYTVISVLVTGSILASRHKPDAPPRKSRWTAVVYVIAFLAGLAFAFARVVNAAWPPDAAALWFADQVLHLVDLPDVMNIFGWHLGPRDTSVLGGTAAMCVRLGVGFWIFRELLPLLRGAAEPAPATAKRPRRPAEPDEEELIALEDDEI